MKITHYQYNRHFPQKQALFAKKQRLPNHPHDSTNRCFSTTATGEESCCQQYTLSFSKMQDILPKHLTFGRA